MKKFITFVLLAGIAGLYILLVGVTTEYFQALLGIIPFSFMVLLGGVFIGNLLANLYIKINGF